MGSMYRGKPIESYSKAELIDIVEEQGEAARKAHREFQKDLRLAYTMTHPNSNGVWIGLVLMGWGLVILAIFAFRATSYRYAHETMTETQLSLWSLQHWIQWVPGLFLVFGGALLTFWQVRRSR